MENITKSQQHSRNANGSVIFGENMYSTHRENDRIKKRFMVAAVSFICIFSVMVILLGFAMSSRAAIAIRLDEMTELYNYQSNKYRTANEYLPEPENPQTCDNCLNSSIIMPLDESDKKFFKSYIITW